MLTWQTSLLACALCGAGQPLHAAASEFHGEKLAEIDASISKAIEEKKMPGAVFWLERGKSIYERAYGLRSLGDDPHPMEKNTIFDAASLTKVVATTPSILLLHERKKLDLDQSVPAYIPEFAGEGRDKITVRHLLTHLSGLRPGLKAEPPWSGYSNAMHLACRETPLTTPGETFRYSDINYILLGEIVQRVSGRPLADFVRTEFYRPLGMNDTGYKPNKALLARIAPTERVDGELLHGVVHDPTARKMGGVAGHAGLFTTAADLARFARMVLHQGELGGKRVLSVQTIQLMRTVQTPLTTKARRGLGWDIDSSYSRPRGRHFPLGSFGHTGWTGTCLWIDPFSKTFWMLLSNRVHPDGKGNILTLQSELGTLAAEAVANFNFAFVPGELAPSLPGRAEPAQMDVLNGIDVLKKNKFGPLKNKRLGLITNHTGVDRDRTATIDLLKNAEGVSLKVLFSPEHGIRGVADEKVTDSIDPKTGLPIYSLYGETRKPSRNQLKELDALVFDIQDIGCRFYTYISTLGLAMEAASEAGLEFFVLDRVNPITGVPVEGPLRHGESSFTAFHDIPVRHGMTVGELAKMFKAERGWKLDLQIIEIQNWTRQIWFDQTGLPWINPSPNMRSLTQAALYPGIGLLETTRLSVGRGTDTPFEVIGAPYIKDTDLARELNKENLPGLRFIPVRFTPRSSVFIGERCAGVNIILTDRAAFPPVEAGIYIAGVLHRLYPKHFSLEPFNRLLVHPPTIELLKNGKPLSEIAESWNNPLREFASRRAKFLLYD